MKSPLSVLPFGFGAALPCALFAQFTGVQLPSALDLGSLFIGFVSASILFAVFSDYARSTRARQTTLAATVPFPAVPSRALNVAAGRLAA